MKVILAIAANSRMTSDINNMTAYGTCYSLWHELFCTRFGSWVMVQKGMGNMVTK